MRLALTLDGRGSLELNPVLQSHVSSLREQSLNSPTAVQAYILGMLLTISEECDSLSLTLSVKH